MHTARTPHLAPTAAPNPQRAAIAVALAPVLVLLAFTLVIAGVIEAATAFATFAACTAWLVHELHRYQQQMDNDATLLLSGKPELRAFGGDYLRELSSDGGGV